MTHAGPFEVVDLAIIGAGAAGLSAAIFAGEAAAGRDMKIVLLDGATKIGAKILISGGGRCNVTNEHVTPEDFWGGPRTIIARVLRAFDERRTIEWMKNLGVELKLEPTGKYFPVTDEARTVLDALVRRAREVGVELRTGVRVTNLERTRGGDFEIAILGEREPLRARRVIVATGGKSLPKTGSDGWGMQIMRQIGHTIHPTTPALSPLILEKNETLGGGFQEFSGLTFNARLELSDSKGRKLQELEGSLLFTHFGTSGPAALNMSRHWLQARLKHPSSELQLTLGAAGLRTLEEADRWLQQQARDNPTRNAATALAEFFPERFARAMSEGTDTLAHLTRERRLDLARKMTRLPTAVIGDRGYAFAEVTAGGVDLREIDPRTMESRIVPGLFLCGEILDVDGRIGGFNFQWAWASGYLAGRGAAGDLHELGKKGAE